MLKEVSRGGLAATKFDYDIAPRVTSVTSPDGTTATAKFDAVSGLPSEVTSSSGYRRCLRYDATERLRATWDNVADCTDELAQDNFRYERANAFGVGAGVMHLETVDRERGVVRGSAAVTSAVGRPVTALRLTDRGWFAEAATRRELQGADWTASTFASERSIASPLSETIPSYWMGSRLLQKSVTDAGSGLPVQGTKLWHQGVEQTMSIEHSARANLIQQTVTEQNEFSVTYAQKGDGSPLFYIDQNHGVASQYVHDASGRLRQMTLPNGEVAKLRYDEHGRVAQVSRVLAGRSLERTYAYDTVSGLLRSIKVQHDNTVDHYEAFAYDGSGRLTTHAYVSASGAAKQVYLYSYDGNGTEAALLPTTRVSQHGRLSAIRGDGFVKAMQYRADGRLALSQLNIAGQHVIETSYAYFDNGELRATSTQTWQPENGQAACEGKVVTKELVLDGLGRAKQVLVNDKVFTDYTYDEQGRVRLTALPDGSIAESIYDPASQIYLGERRLMPDGSVSETSRHYSARGLIDSEKHGTQTSHYTYAADRTLESASGGESFSYVFDPMTFAPKQISEGAVTRTMNRAGDVMLLGAGSAAAALTFDAQGRVIQKSRANAATATYTYGLDGQIHEVSVGGEDYHYIYDEGGQRLAKLDATGRIVAASSALGVLGASGWREPVPYQSGVLGLLDHGGLQSFDADVRGSLLDAPNEAMAHPSPFGHRANQPTLAQTSSFIGQPFDADIGAVRLGMRDFDPEFAMFLQPDPLYLANPSLCINDPVSCSLYAYGHNDPVNHIDPTGLSDTDIYDGGSGGAGGGAGGGGGGALTFCFIFCWDSPQQQQDTSSHGGTPYQPAPRRPPVQLPSLPSVAGSQYALGAPYSSFAGGPMLAGDGATVPGGGGLGLEQSRASTDWRPTSYNHDFSWAGSLYHASSIYARYATGLGSRWSLYGPNSSATDAMRASRGYQAAWMSYQQAAHNAGGPIPLKIDNLPGASTLSESLRNPLSFVVGTFSAEFVPISPRAVRVELLNVTSTSSLGHGIFDPPNELPSWDWGPGSNVLERWIWMEELP